MLFLFIGFTAVSLAILIGIPLEEALTFGQQLFLLALSTATDLLVVLPYWVGRKFSNSQTLHWSTLIIMGVLVSVLTQVLFPNAGLPYMSTSGAAALIFLGVAFVPNSIEFWSAKPN